MFSRKPTNDRAGSRRATRGAVAVALTLSAALASEAQAQELVHRFINPAFGGNPFNSDHLLATANADRPKEPQNTAPPASDEELIARQIRGRFLSDLSADITEAIATAKPGQSGNFEFGDQRISFTRTQTETRITFVNARTGERSEVVIPVTGASSSSAPGASSLSALASPEQALGAFGATPTAPLTGNRSSTLDSGPVEFIPGPGF